MNTLRKLVQALTLRNTKLGLQHPLQQLPLQHPLHHQLHHPLQHPLQQLPLHHPLQQLPLHHPLHHPLQQLPLLLRLPRQLQVREAPSLLQTLHLQFLTKEPPVTPAATSGAAVLGNAITSVLLFFVGHYFSS